ncbi:MAG: MFS transporter [Armatimonadota bacterium]
MLVGAGILTTTLDIGIVNVALPTLGNAFGVGIGTSQWFTLAFTFVIVATLTFFGKASDILGKRKVYITGISIFAIGSISCSLVTSAQMLIIYRVIEGFGASMTMSCGLALVAEVFSAKSRGKAMGVIGTCVALGYIIGPVVGGILLEYIGWRTIFLVNVPIFFVILYHFIFRIRGLAENKNGSFDLAGSITMAITLSALMAGITMVGNFGLLSQKTIALFLSAIIFGILFVSIEKKSKSPVLDIRILSSFTVSTSSLSAVLLYAGIVPVLVFLPFYLQKVLIIDPSITGFVVATGPLTYAIVAPMFGSLSDRIGSPILTTLGIIICGVCVNSIGQLNTDSTTADVVLRLFIMHIGSGLFIAPNTSMIMGSVACIDLGVASGIVSLARNLGMASGIALCGALINSATSGVDTESTDYINAFLNGFNNGMTVLSIILFIGGMICIVALIRSKRKFSNN